MKTLELIRNIGTSFGKPAGLTTLLVVAVTVLASCTTSKQMRREMLEHRADLYYDLATPVYKAEVNDTVYLEFIDYSNMDIYSNVRRKSGWVVPLFFYNYRSQAFEATLGERSLRMNYWEFLRLALLAECNRSTGLQLMEAEECTPPPHALYLRVKVKKNATSARMKLRDTAVFTGYLDLILGNEEEDAILPFFVGHSNHKVFPAVTELVLEATLHKADGRPLLVKEYAVKRSYQSTSRGYGDTYIVNRTCLDVMAESLSLATREVVERLTEDVFLQIESGAVLLDGDHGSPVTVLAE